MMPALWNAREAVGGGRVQYNWRDQWSQQSRIRRERSGPAFLGLIRLSGGEFLFAY